MAVDLGFVALDTCVMTNQDDSQRETLADLTAEEKRTLAELARQFVRTDGELTDAEREEVAFIAERAGADDFWKLMDSAAESGDSLEAVLVRAQKIKAVGAHELIYGTMYELSIIDGTDSGENELLDKLATIWKLEIQDLSEE